MPISKITYRSANTVNSARSVDVVAPSDSADLPKGRCIGLYVAGAGDVAIETDDGARATLASLDSQYHPICISRVYATGTTATGIVALY